MKAFEHHYWTVECDNCGATEEGDTERQALKYAAKAGYRMASGDVNCGDCADDIEREDEEESNCGCPCGYCADCDPTAYGEDEDDD